MILRAKFHVVSSLLSVFKIAIFVLSLICPLWREFHFNAIKEIIAIQTGKWDRETTASDLKQ